MKSSVVSVSFVSASSSSSRLAERRALNVSAGVAWTRALVTPFAAKFSSAAAHSEVDAPPRPRRETRAPSSRCARRRRSTAPPARFFSPSFFLLRRPPPARSLRPRRPSRVAHRRAREASPSRAATPPTLGRPTMTPTAGPRPSRVLGGESSALAIPRDLVGRDGGDGAQRDSPPPPPPGHRRRRDQAARRRRRASFFAAAPPAAAAVRFQGFTERALGGFPRARRTRSLARFVVAPGGATFAVPNVVAASRPPRVERKPARSSCGAKTRSGLKVLNRRRSSQVVCAASFKSRGAPHELRDARDAAEPSPRAPRPRRARTARTEFALFRSLVDEHLVALARAARAAATAMQCTLLTPCPGIRCRPPPTAQGNEANSRVRATLASSRSR